MRSAQNGVRGRFPSVAGARWCTLLCLASVLTGCAAGPSTRDNLATAYKELESPTPDSTAIMEAADAYLKQQPNGPAAADAYYLHGRALEDRAQRNLATAQQDSAAAYNDYSQALTQKPRPALEGLIHVGMGNILYFQDRYSAALGELSAGYAKVERDTDKAWALYRMGLCEQRMAQWTDADQHFAQVQQQFPDTAPALRAREHQGATAFWVQVGTYASSAAADAVAADLKRQGQPSQRFVDTARNAQVVRVGPFNTYDAAVATKQRIWSKYRDAIIVP